MSAVWRIELIGGLRAVGPGRVVDRFRTRQTGALLAYLALYRDRAHPRDALADRFWPDADPHAARHRLSVALSSLRSLLALPDHPVEVLLLTTRDSAQLNPGLATTDAADFQAALDAADRAPSPVARIAPLAAAIDRYHGELLPGLEDSWVIEARLRIHGSAPMRSAPVDWAKESA